MSMIAATAKSAEKLDANELAKLTPPDVCRRVYNYLFRDKLRAPSPKGVVAYIHGQLDQTSGKSNIKPVMSDPTFLPEDRSMVYTAKQLTTHKPKPRAYHHDIPGTFQLVIDGVLVTFLYGSEGAPYMEDGKMRAAIEPGAIIFPRGTLTVDPVQQEWLFHFIELCPWNFGCPAYIPKEKQKEIGMDVRVSAKYEGATKKVASTQPLVDENNLHRRDTLNAELTAKILGLDSPGLVKICIDAQIPLRFQGNDEKTFSDQEQRDEMVSKINTYIVNPARDRRKYEIIEASLGESAANKRKLIIEAMQLGLLSNDGKVWKLEGEPVLWTIMDGVEVGTEASWLAAKVVTDKQLNWFARLQVKVEDKRRARQKAAVPSQTHDEIINKALVDEVIVENKTARTFDWADGTVIVTFGPTNSNAQRRGNLYAWARAMTVHVLLEEIADHTASFVEDGED